MGKNTKKEAAKAIRTDMQRLVMELEQLPYAFHYLPEGEGKAALRKYHEGLCILLALAVPPGLRLPPEWETPEMLQFRRAAVSSSPWGLADEFVSACFLVEVLGDLPPSMSDPAFQLTMAGWFSALHWTLFHLPMDGDGPFVQVPPRPIGLDGEPLPPIYRGAPPQAVPEYLGEGTAPYGSIGRCTCGCAVYSHHNYCYNCGALLRWDACAPA